MLKKKSSVTEKKRKHSKSEERQESNKRRSSESRLQDSRDDLADLADPELDRIGSDIEEGGLDLSIPFQTIAAYVGEKKEMLKQCFHVLGEKKLRKMLPDELKECSLEEIQTLCWEQLQMISDKNLLQILAGEELTAVTSCRGTSETQQDNNVDSTSCLKEAGKSEDPKQEGGGSGEESDVLSINADTYDSDIEGPKEEQKSADVAVKVSDSRTECADPVAVNPEPADPEMRKDIQNDIDRSVSEILALASTRDKAKKQSRSVPPADAESPVRHGPPTSSINQPSVQQLELLELEMRARAIKALMKAGEKKKLCMTANV